MAFKSTERKEVIIFFAWIALGSGMIIGGSGIEWFAKAREILLGIGIGILAPALMELMHHFLQKNPTEIVQEALKPSIDRLDEKISLNNLVMKSSLLGIKSFYSSRDELGAGFLKTLITPAKKKIYLLSSLFEEATHNRNLVDLLCEKKKQGCEIRILLVDPKGEMAARIQREQGQEEDYINKLTKVIDSLKKHGMTSELKKHNRTNLLSLLLVDDKMYVTHYLYHWQGNDCPTIELTEKQDGLFQKYLEHFEFYWRSATSCEARNKTANNSQWLVSYYNEKKRRDTLFNCQIGELTKYIPFITNENWAEFRDIPFKIDGNAHLIKFDATNQASSEIDYDLINQRFVEGTKRAVSSLKCNRVC